MSKTISKRLKAALHRVAMLEKENRFLTRSAAQRSGEIRALQELVAVRESMLGVLADQSPDGIVQMEAIDIVIGKEHFRTLCELVREVPEGNAVLKVWRVLVKNNVSCRIS